MNSKLSTTVRPDHNDTILIINGFEDDPLCDEIRKLAAAKQHKVNMEDDTRPDAPVVKLPNTATLTSRAMSVIKTILQRLSITKFRHHKSSNDKV